MQEKRMRGKNYEIQLRYNGRLIGNIYPITEKRSWSKVKNGVDQIKFSVSMLKFQEWCVERNTTLRELITPLRLDARVVRDGTPLLGGILLEIPSYQFSNSQVDTVLDFTFDGYLNIYAGNYIRPTKKYGPEPLNSYLLKILNDANNRASNAGAPTGVTIGHIDTLGNDQNTYDSFKSVKDALTEQTDNIDGAGTFDIDFTYDRQFCIYKKMGENRTKDIVIRYPSYRGELNATSVSFDGWSNLATHIIGVGAGNGVDPNGAAIVEETTSAQDTPGIQRFGYYEYLFQDSSISVRNTLKNRISGYSIAGRTPYLKPKITIVGNYINIGNYFWIGDRFTFLNDLNPFMETSAVLRAVQLDCDIDDNNVETLTITTEVE